MTTTPFRYRRLNPGATPPCYEVVAPWGVLGVVRRRWRGLRGAGIVWQAERDGTAVGQAARLLVAA